MVIVFVSEPSPPFWQIASPFVLKLCKFLLPGDTIADHLLWDTVMLGWCQDGSCLLVSVVLTRMPTSFIGPPVHFVMRGWFRPRKQLEGPDNAKQVVASLSMGFSSLRWPRSCATWCNASCKQVPRWSAEVVSNQNNYVTTMSSQLLSVRPGPYASLPARGSHLHLIPSQRK